MSITNIITNFIFYTDTSFKQDEETGRTIKVTVGQVFVQTSDEKGDHFVSPRIFDVPAVPIKTDFVTVSLDLFNKSWTAELFGIYLAIYKVYKNDNLRINRFATYTICSDCQPSIFAAQCLAIECQRRFENNIVSDKPIADNFLYLFGAYKYSKASDYDIMTKDASFVTILRGLEMLYKAILKSNEMKGRHGYDFSFAYVPAHFENRRKRNKTPIYNIDFSKCNILVKETALDLFYFMYADEIADIYPGYKTKIPESVYSFMSKGVENILEKKPAYCFFKRATLNKIKDAMVKLTAKKGEVAGRPVLTGVAEKKGNAKITVCDIEKKISTVLGTLNFADLAVEDLNSEKMLEILKDLVAQEKDKTRTISQISKRTKGVVRRTGERKKIRDIPAISVRSSFLRNRQFFSHRKFKIIRKKPKFLAPFIKKVVVLKMVKFGVLSNDPNNIFYNEPNYVNVQETKEVVVERLVDDEHAPDIIEKVPEPITPADAAREQEADIELEDTEASKDFESYMDSFIKSVEGEVEASNRWWNETYGHGGSFDSNVVNSGTSINTLMRVSFMRYIPLPTL